MAKSVKPIEKAKGKQAPVEKKTPVSNLGKAKKAVLKNEKRFVNKSINIKDIKVKEIESAPAIQAEPQNIVLTIEDLPIQVDTEQISETVETLFHTKEDSEGMIKVTFEDGSSRLMTGIEYENYDFTVAVNEKQPLKEVTEIDKKEAERLQYYSSMGGIDYYNSHVKGTPF